MSPWIETLRQALDAEHGDRPRVVTLATVDRDGHPRSRSVVCRRIEDEGAIWITSDARSGKNGDTRREPRAEMVVWLAGLRQQFRVSGIVAVLGPGSDDPRRLEAWRGLSDATRATFLWPPPGRPREADPEAFPVTMPVDAEPPDNFELLVLDPERVDHLDLNPTPHRRRRWYGDGDWVEQELNP